MCDNKTTDYLNNGDGFVYVNNAGSPYTHTHTQVHIFNTVENNSLIDKDKDYSNH